MSMAPFEIGDLKVPAFGHLDLVLVTGPLDDDGQGGRRPEALGR